MDRPSQGTPDRGYERNIILGGKVSLLAMFFTFGGGNGGEGDTTSSQMTVPGTGTRTTST